MRHYIRMKAQRPARIPWIGAGAPWRRLRRRHWRAPRAREGCPAPIREIRTDLRVFMFLSLFVPLCAAQPGPQAAPPRLSPLPGSYAAGNPATYSALPGTMRLPQDYGHA
ncbi:unnamed protein product [Prorocentrum cordatum]|uniref:Uncharacterized protein n=1 Tax=Prorocentrum cordatum TaxID=2364126 RepID=A0ABN9TRH4_9DINO|nr:unnamed protein product [Polarella glacialis]